MLYCLSFEDIVYGAVAKLPSARRTGVDRTIAKKIEWFVSCPTVVSTSQSDHLYHLACAFSQSDYSEIPF